MWGQMEQGNELYTFFVIFFVYSTVYYVMYDFKGVYLNLKGKLEHFLFKQKLIFL